MDEDEQRALEAVWQSLLIKPIQLREQLNLGQMLRIAFEAGWNGGVAFQAAEQGS